MAIRKGATPVSIPNTTVKILPADDTAARGCGKAGGCRTFLKESFRGVQESSSLSKLIGTTVPESTLKTEYRRKPRLYRKYKRIEKTSREKIERSRTKELYSHARLYNRRRLSKKSAGWMPWHWEPKKDVISCEKPRSAANKHSRGCPNGETRYGKPVSLYHESIVIQREPAELKHLSRRRKRKKHRLRK